MTEEDAPGVNRDFGPPRVLELRGPDALEKEMSRLGVDPAGIGIMTHKGRTIVVRVTGMGHAQANILKQEMLSLGGECAYARGVVTAQTRTTDVLLMGTPKHYEGLMSKLAGQPFDLGRLAGEVGAALRNYTHPSLTPLALPTGRLEWGKRTYIMGILNLTPDSFSDGGRFTDPEAAAAHARAMAEAGAHIIDIGGESTRPGSEPVTAEEEMERVLPVVEKVAKEVALPVSIDTTKAEVARRALEMGAHIINDISGLRGDPDMVRVASGSGAPVVIMHMKGEPRTMQEAPSYDDVMEEIFRFFSERRGFAVEGGVEPHKIILDPGIGFGKRVEDNVSILARLGEFRCLGCPILVGASRKSFIGALSGAGVEDRLPGSVASATAAVAGGADIVRVHDVAETAQALAVADAALRGP